MNTLMTLSMALRQATLKMLIAVAALSAIAPDLHAQWNASRLGESRHRLYTTAGIDPAVITSLGYSYTPTMFGRPVQVGIEGGVVAAGSGIDDFRARLQAGLSVAQWKSFRVTTSGAFVTRGTTNTIYRAVNMGVDLGGTAGVYRRHWFAAGELGYDKAVVTRLTPTDWYRSNFYPDAKSGWYIDTGGTWRFGAVTGVSIGRTELSLRAGIPVTQRGQSIAVPAYASIGVGRAF